MIYPKLEGDDNILASSPSAFLRASVPLSHPSCHMGGFSKTDAVGGPGCS